MFRSKHDDLSSPALGLTGGTAPTVSYSVSAHEKEGRHYEIPQESD